jgi:predicted nucleic acid-binding protein
LIYFDSSALLKFVKPEKQSEALRSWRLELDPGVELVTSRLAALEIGRTLLRAEVDRERVPYIVGQALRGLYLLDLTSTVLTRAQSYGIRKLGSLDAIHLASANPFLPELTGFVTYGAELADAAAELGISVVAPG